MLNYIFHVHLFFLFLQVSIPPPYSEVTVLLFIICFHVIIRILVHCVVPLEKQVKVSWLHSRHMHWHSQIPSWPWLTRMM
jgi:hypothetical protein